jgi:SWI/SNF-related matrix-associated actin-dependent regulator 1 of chromatin subfamily A
MTLSIKKRNEVFDILNNYAGKNSHILYLKQKRNLNDPDCEYILMNHTKTEPVLIDKIVKIAEYYGKELQQRYNIPFTPVKLNIYTLSGETDSIYHCWVKWSQNQDKWVSLFIPKRALLDQLIEIKWEYYPVDIDKLNQMLSGYDRKILPHQIPAIKFLNANRKCVLADEMGLTKTASAIAASINGNFDHILIISPASVKSTWKKEIGFFGINDVEIVHGTDRSKWDLSKKYVICNPDIIDKHLHEVVYDTVIDQWSGKPKQVKSKNKKKIAEVNEQNPLMSAKFNLIIVDECHKFSNSTSARYKALLDFLNRSECENIYCLSGTPISNSHTNYFNILKLINSEITKDYHYYYTRYCGARKMRLRNGREILKPNGDTNGNELYEKCKHIYLRRLKSEIPGLPERDIIERYYDLTSKQLKEYEKLWEEYEKEKAEEGKKIDELNKELISGGIYRQYLAKQMIPNTVELTESWLESGSKVIIGCCYNEELDIFKQHFGDKCVTYHGGMTEKQKDIALNEFNNNENIDVFIGNIIASGVGITCLSTVKNRPSNVLILNSFDFVPGNLKQFIDRNYRVGVMEHVYSYIQIFNNTACEWVYNKIIKKSLVIDTVIKDENNKNTSQ